MRRMWRVWGALWACGLSACAHFPDEHYPMSEGWRLGHVRQSVGVNDVWPALGVSQDCRGVPNRWDSTANPQWLLLDFRRPPHVVYRIVPIPPGVRVQTGDEVYVNVQDCDVAVVPRLPLDRRGGSSQAD